MTEATIGAASGVHYPTQPIPAAGKRRRLRRRHLWLIPGLAIAVYANSLGERNGVGIPALIAFGIAPHLPLLLGLGRRRDSGLRSFSVLAFNVLHHPVAALAAAAVGAIGAATGWLPTVFLVAALVWFSHIVIGWGVGDGIRSRAGHPK
jgi:hypothetical protein